MDSFPIEEGSSYLCHMKNVIHFQRIFIGACAAAMMFTSGCAENTMGQKDGGIVSRHAKAEAMPSQGPKQFELDPEDPEWDAQVEVVITESVASFVGGDTLAQIAADMADYFQKSNNMDWAAAMGHHPLHRQPDTAFVRKAVEVMDQFSDRGLRNRTEKVEILYASKRVDDQDQEVVLINMDLVHFVDFDSKYQGNVEGMRGMIESNYGKGNGTYKEGAPSEVDSLPPYRYWEIRGKSRIWALSAKDSTHWCFLPANFNEGGGGNYMSGQAMVEALRHRREFDPNYVQK